jgi:hypothetical protein
MRRLCRPEVVKIALTIAATAADFAARVRRDFVKSLEGLLAPPADC